MRIINNYPIPHSHTFPTKHQKVRRIAFYILKVPPPFFRCLQASAVPTSVAEEDTGMLGVPPLERKNLIRTGERRMVKKKRRTHKG